MRNKSFIDNERISSRQILRLYVFDLMGIATLLLPPYLAKLCGASSVYAILVGSLLGYLYLRYLGWVMKQMGTDVVAYLESKNCRVGGKMLSTWVAFHATITAGFCAYVFANLMQYSLVHGSTYVWILFLILGVGAYAVKGGIECRARVYEVMFWFVLIPFLVMMLSSVRNCKWRYLEGILVMDTSNLGKGVYLVFLLLTPLFFVLFLIGEKEKQYGKTMIKTVSISLLISLVVLLGSFVLLLGNFGVSGLSELRFPIVTLMSTIQFEGNFLKRMDALMLAVWFFTLYALLNLHLHYGVKMFRECTGRNWVILPTVGAFLVAYLMHVQEIWLSVFLAYYSYVAVPCMIIVPAIIVFIGRKK